jgi:hypothetical protein
MCKCDEIELGIPDATQKEMQNLHSSEVTRPKLIQYGLRAKKIAEKTLIKIANWIKYY